MTSRIGVWPSPSDGLLTPAWGQLSGEAHALPFRRDFLASVTPDALA